MDDSSDKLNPGRPVVFGEVLFDVFPDGSRVLGGAPFNVAWHLQGFGLNPLFISRVGQDESGQEVLTQMQAWGMDTRGVQIDSQHPTGTVKVTLASGQPSFDIVADQAYDFINATLARDLVAASECSILYFGTLAARAEASAGCLERLRAFGLPAFVDLNLRPPWWNQPGVVSALRGACWLKLNGDELATVVQQPDLSGDDLRDAAKKLVAEYELSSVILTLGAEGACIVHDDDVSCGEPVPVAKLVDTVGAGDAFSAATIVGLALGWPEDTTLERALTFASAVCGRRGATHTDSEMYANYLHEWAG